MGEIHRVPELEVTVQRDEVARFLGYGRSRLPGRVRHVLGEIEGDAPGLLSPSCAYRLMKNEEYAHSPYLSELGELALCLVTIGGRLEAQVSRHKEHGDLGRAMILDSYGSAAAEAAADAAEAIILEEADRLGLRSSRRFSPGYGRWDVEEQRWILPALDAGSLGVTLTEHCMMVPRKSITFAVALGEDPAEMREANVCEYCGMVNCRYRHTIEKCYEGGDR